MFWLDYTVQSFPNGDFIVEGDWPGEVMGWDKDGNKKGGLKVHPLYQPGDVFVVDTNGRLRKSDHLSTLMMKYEQSKVDKAVD